MQVNGGSSENGRIFPFGDGPHQKNHSIRHLVKQLLQPIFVFHVVLAIMTVLLKSKHLPRSLSEEDGVDGWVH